MAVLEHGDRVPPTNPGAAGDQGSDGFVRGAHVAVIERDDTALTMVVQGA